MYIFVECDLVSELMADSNLSGGNPFKFNWASTHLCTSIYCIIDKTCIVIYSFCHFGYFHIAKWSIACKNFRRVLRFPPLLTTG